MGVIDGTKFMKKLGITLTDVRKGSSKDVTLPPGFDGVPDSPPPITPVSGKGAQLQQMVVCRL